MGRWLAPAFTKSIAIVPSPVERVTPKRAIEATDEHRGPQTGRVGQGHHSHPMGEPSALQNLCLSVSICGSRLSSKSFDRIHGPILIWGDGAHPPLRKVSPVPSPVERVTPKSAIEATDEH